MKPKWNSLPPTLLRLARSRAARIAVSIVAVYALLGFLLLPYLLERHIPTYAREQLARQAEVADVRFNPFLLRLEADGFRLREADGRPLIAARHLAVDFQLSSLLRWAWTFADVHADGLELHIVSAADGRLNLRALADSFPAGDEPPRADARTVRLLLSRIAVRDGAVTYTDLAVGPSASATLRPVNLELENVSTLPERDGAYAFNAEFPGGGSLYLQGTTRIKPFSTDGILSIQGVRPAAYWPLLEEHLRLAEPRGELVLQADYRFVSEHTGPRFALDKLVAHLAGLDVREPDAAAPLLALEAVELEGGQLDVAERRFAVQQLTLRSGQVSARVAKDGRTDWQNLLTAPAAPAARKPATPRKPAAPWQVRLADVMLDGIAVHAQDHSRGTPLQLDADRLGARLAFDIHTGTATRVDANAATIDVQRLRLKPLDADAPLATLERVELAQGRLDSAERRIAIGRLALRGGATRIERDAQGRLNLVELRAAPAQTAARAKPAAGASAWRFTLDTLQLDALRATVVDHGVKPALRYDLADIGATVSALGNDARKPASFTASLRVEQGGTLTAKGGFKADGSAANAQLEMERFALEPLRGLLARHAALDLKQGNASAKLGVDYAKTADAPVLRANGSAHIDDLRIDEESTGDRFLSWQTLRADAIAFESAAGPARLSVKEMRLVAPRAKVEIFEDRSVNLGKVFEKKSAPAPQSAPARTSTQTQGQESMQVAIARVRVENGRVFYSDRSLVLPFAAQIREFHGSATGIASARDSRTRLEFEGRVEDYGSAKVSGALSPFEPKRFTDIRTQFRNIDMPTLSPYSATFAGRKIAAGKLSLDLEYKIEDGVLAGDNDILLERFTLGERVASPDALDLPLDLAVALLTDSRGRIDIAIPVRGNMNKPQFSLGGVIGEAVTRMLTRIVTAPFSALGKLLGGKDEASNRIAFEPGSTRLTPPQQEKLVNVAKALRDRPQLKLTVDGRYAAELDGRALRAERVRRALAAALDIELAADETPGPVAFDQADTQRALEELLEAQAGAAALDEFQAAYEKRTGKTADRVNPVLGLIGQASADHAFYEALYERLVQIQPLDEAALQALARQRAQAVAAALSGADGIAAERIAVGAPAAAQANRDRMVETQLSLEVYQSSK